MRKILFSVKTSSQFSPTLKRGPNTVEIKLILPLFRAIRYRVLRFIFSQSNKDFLTENYYGKI